MIVPMKKVTLFCLETERSQCLDIMSGLGLLHPVHLRTPAGAELDALRQNLASLQSASDALPPLTKPVSTVITGDAAALAARIHTLVQERQVLQESMEDAQAELLRMQSFGRVDPSMVEQVRAGGIQVALLRCEGAKSADLLAALQRDNPGAVLQQIQEKDKNFKHCILLSQKDLQISEGWQQVALPSQSTAQLQAQVGKAQARLQQIVDELQELSVQGPLLQQALRQGKESLQVATAGAGMLSHAALCAIRGFCPEPRLADLQQAARSKGWGLQVQDPSDQEMVPTLLKQAPWVKPINTLFAMIGILPGYREIDISAVFLLFFTLFFGMLVGDAGYGLLFLGITLWARKKFPQAPSQVFAFAGTMSGITILWGILTATWFGITPEALPSLLTSGQIVWLRDSRNLQNLCFMIGTVHLTIAHLWNIWLMRSSLQSLAQLGWLATTWTMFFLANQLVLGQEFPPYMKYVFVAGVVLIILFNIPIKKLKEEWFNLVMLPLNLVSNFVDVVSYIRLFAVGSATFAVANSFNNMLAPMLGGWTAPVAALLLFLGHGLNITLAVMGVLVHGVRLNTLEFSNHIGLQWTGEAYAPLERKTQDLNP